MSNPTIEEEATTILSILNGLDALHPCTESADAKKPEIIREQTRQRYREIIAPIVPETIQKLHELFAKIQNPRLPEGSFHTRLEQLRNALRSEPFPHKRVGEIDMSKYSAMAITHALRVIMGDKADITTVFGHYEPFRITQDEEGEILERFTNEPDLQARTKDQMEHPATNSKPHYWTKITVNGETYFCDATYGELKYMQSERIVFARENELEGHGLYRQTISGTTSPEDIQILLEIHQNGGNPRMEFTQERTRKAYEQLVQCITMNFAPKNLTPKPLI